MQLLKQKQQQFESILKKKLKLLTDLELNEILLQQIFETATPALNKIVQN